MEAGYFGTASEPPEDPNKKKREGKQKDNPRETAFEGVMRKYKIKRGDPIRDEIRGEIEAQKMQGQRYTGYKEIDRVTVDFLKARNRL